MVPLPDSGRKTSKPSRHAVLLAAVLLAAVPPVLAQAAPTEEVFDNPPGLAMEMVESRELPVAGLATGAAAGGTPAPHEAKLDLRIVYTEGTIFNPASGRYDQVKLRSYQGQQIDPKYPFISPMIEVDPGDTLRITLRNQLPKDETCLSSSTVGVNTPHCFNGTNLHTHGLWVNPAGNSDNVLISVNPGVDFQYEYNIPSDHPAGTFWYHTHRHGSTAMQVASGMAGALIVRGNRPPRVKDGKIENGDVDVLLRPTKTQPFRERVVVAQQIQYACRDKETGAIKTNADKTYRCDEGDVGEIDKYDVFGVTAGVSNWSISGRYTTLNGRMIPTFKGAKAGQIERWRVIHGGVRDTINLEFRPLAEAEKNMAGAMTMSAAEQDAFVQQACSGEALPQHLIADDGLTLSAVRRSSSTVLQPAYRVDALMVFPKAGTYCVIDGSIPAPGNVEQDAPPSRRLLGFVKVGAGKDVAGDLTEYLKKELLAAADVNIPGSKIRSQVKSDLENGLKLGLFTPHPDLLGLTPDGQQTLVFNIGGGKFEIGNGDTPPQPYDPARIDRTLVLGHLDEWSLTSLVASHPFHIHINPFQVVAVYDPNGKDVSGPDAVDDYSGAVDPQYRGLKGVFKDSMWVKLAGGKSYKIVVRSKYERYIGDFVLHCHILDHEDQGMMQNVRIALPDGAGGAASAHGHH